MKTCSKCSKDKPYTEFHRQTSTKDGHGAYCISCKSEYTRHKQLTSAEFRSQRSNAVMKWMRNNREEAKQYKRTYESKPINRIKRNLRKRLRQLLDGKAINTEITCSSIGCSRKELKAYLEQRFQQGMTWENYGEWHVDHVKPLCLFNLLNSEERRAANLYTNLQPLWAKDNIVKGDSYTAPPTN